MPEITKTIKSAWFSEKEYLQQFKQLIKRKDLELQQKFDPHTSVDNLLKEKSDFIDELLSSTWLHFLGDYADNLCLIAVGGYGRRELFPHSDIDIVIVLDHNNISVYQEMLTNFSTFLWDIGLKPGQSVRTVEECVTAAINDQTVMTSLMENRLITGNAALYQKLRNGITPDKIWPSDQFFAVKMWEQLLRHAKYHDTAYNLEPNIKDGLGGLRDLQVITWVFKRHYNSETLRELIKYGFLPESEYNQLFAALHVLWRIRYALHLLTNSCEDRLIFDYQRDLARQFGFSKDNQQYNEDVEQFMQFYFKTILELQHLNEMLLQLFQERFVVTETNKETESLDDRFVIINSYLEAKDEQIFERQPLALFEIFLILQKNTELKGIRATTIRLIRKSLHLIDDNFRQNKTANHLFVEIFRQPNGLTTQLRRMNRYGVLSAYLSSFANIVARMQYDLFHIYTVDEHTLFVIRNLRRFALEKHWDELPFCSEIFVLINKPEILYISALFHDIAKGLNGDHSTLGEDIVRDFCRQHGFSTQDIKLITWLVRNHLVMSMTAQRMDISDPDVIQKFAQKVGSIEYLNHLYLLTVADIRATNPGLWNAWKDSLLKELYKATRSTLRRELQNPLTQNDRIQENKKEAEDELRKLGFTEAALEKVWQHVNDDYFLRYSTDEIVWQASAIASTDDNDLPVVILRPQTRRGNAEVFVYAKNVETLFSISTATLDQLGLSILDARIMTTNDDYVLDSFNTFQVLEYSGQPVSEEYRITHICNTLRNNLLHQQVKDHINIHRLSRQAKYFPIPTDVQFQADLQNNQTILELISTDRPGLLSQVGQVFNNQGINLHSARITTIGSRVEDMFYITDLHLQPLTDPSKQELLREELTFVLDENMPDRVTLNM
ncbi:[protein-PII] uridylyltransferase [Methyloglobulus sp.]|uniref:[protein-PII] uridylyltransferase n=1 Tax=Methyloglobulus sp. TaxID=2518622 RepID=UPI0032B702B3